MNTLSIRALFRALFSRIFDAHNRTPALIELIRRRARSLSAFLLQIILRPNGRGRPPTSPRDKQIARSQEISKLQTDSVHSYPSPPSYTIVPNGNIISLEGISASSYPFANGNIRNSRSRSSIRSTGTPLQSRPASRASSVMNIGTRTSSVSNIELQPTMPSRHHTPRLQASTAQLFVPTPERRDTLSPGIEVDSPPDDSPTTNEFPLNRPYSITTSSLGAGSSNTSVNSFEILSFTHVHVTADQNPTGSSIDIHPDVAIIPTSGHSSVKDHDIEPVTPGETERYRRRTKIIKADTNIDIEPVQLDFSEPGLPKGWTRHAHPEGARYFYNKEKRVYTDAEIYDPIVLKRLNQDIHCLRNLKDSFQTPFPQDSEIVVDVYRTTCTDGFKSSYYCVDHATKLVFFLDPFQAKYLETWQEVQGVRSRDQLKYEMMAQYWFFVQLYPHSVQLSKAMVAELRGIVLHLIGDSMTSPYSTAAYTLADLHKILSLTNELEKNLGSLCAGSTSLYARKMYIFNHSRFLNFHGESCARIERNFSVYDDPLYRRTHVITILSPFLFSAPDVHLRTLQKMWVDKQLHKSVWEECMKKMYDEWEQFVFFSTVVLNANVAFLAIQTVDVDNHPYRSPAQISSYVSVISNVSSIILGLLLMRQNRTKSKDTADEMQTFLVGREHPLFGLETMAILYSLPYALLMWGVVSFLVAFCLMCFDNANLATHTIVGSFCAAMAILVAWCIWSSWEKKKEEEMIDRSLAYLPGTQEDISNGSLNGSSSQNLGQPGEEPSVFQGIRKQLAVFHMRPLIQVGHRIVGQTSNPV